MALQKQTQLFVFMQTGSRQKSLGLSCFSVGSSSLTLVSVDDVGYLVHCISLQGPWCLMLNMGGGWKTKIDKLMN